MNIWVTGGAGFIGSHVFDALVAAGHRVRILDSIQDADDHVQETAAELAAYQLVK